MTMKQSSNDEQFQSLWDALQSDANYPGLADYVMEKNADLETDLTDLRDSIYEDISQESRDSLDEIIVTLCHPPPGCGGTDAKASKE